MLHQVVLGRIGIIAPINVVSKFGPILYLMHTLYGSWERATTSKTIKKNIKPNVKINILDEAYALQDEGIA
jgi:hypothetical protein